MIPSLLSLCSAAVLAPAAVSMVQEDASQDGDRLVAMEVFADRSAIRPGERFTLGVRMKIERGWHIYWENPGDSGLATRVDVRGPDGFELGPTRFPAPERHEQEGDIVTFVHHRELVLLRDVVAPETLAASAPVRFDIEGRWLACIEICLPGSKTMELTLPVAPRESAVQPANDKLFAEWRAQLPKPWSQNERATTHWSSNADRHVLALLVPESTEIQFFPRVSDVVHLKHQSFVRDGSAGKLELEFTLEPARLGEAIPEHVIVDGVVHMRSATGDQVFELGLPFPKSASSTQKNR
jgi:DsbC/DsbD-like thiol-disulfide interchange protein